MDLSSEPICCADRQSLDADGQPVLALPANWDGLKLGVFPLPAVERRGPSHTPYPVLVMALQGRGRRWYRHGLHTVELTAAPEMLDLYGGRYERDRARWDGQPGMTVGVHFQPDVVAMLTHESGFDFETRHELFDPRLSWLVHTLHIEAQRGAPGGALFVQGLSIALIGWLREHYGRRTVAPARGSLTPVQRKQVVDFVEANLGEDLSVTQLAQQAALSPERFAAAFKACYGSTPYRWVQQRRVDEATKLLKTTTKPIVDIALALGFSSQSHFTQTFRQMTGTTPARVRQS